MTTKDAIAYFGTGYALAQALGLQPPVVYRWGEYPPPLRQFQLERATGGTLTVEPGLIPPAHTRANAPKPSKGILRKARTDLPNINTAVAVAQQPRPKIPPQKPKALSLAEMMAAGDGNV